uniref:Ras converting CAAX endopeptidase 1 n=1 Tax=Mandrillus leucophaeus TaxID=9568 RepID=A0A2K6ADQ8_MANLE
MAALGGDGLRLLSVSRPERPPESAALGGPGPGLCCWVSVFSCLSLACSYVGSLYVWKSELPRDHPAVIKRRFTSVLVVSSLSPLCVLLWRELTGIQVLPCAPDLRSWIQYELSPAPQPSPPRGTAGEGLAGVPEISGIFVGD